MLSLRRWLREVMLAPVLLVSLSAAASSETPRADAALFAYDREAGFDVREAGAETREDAVIRDIAFTVGDRSVKAYLVTPTMPHHALAAILYVHWLGHPATTNRSEFLNEAVALAGQGVVSLLVDAMWSEPRWYANRVPEEDHEHSIRQVIELRRAMDLLLTQPGVDPRRVAFVGHDFGAMYGTIAGALDRRAKTYVLMAGTPHFIDWFLFARQPANPAEYRARLAPLDPIRFVPDLAPASIFFQFAANDEYVTPAAAAATYAAAAPRKQCTTYQAGHDLQTPEVAADRITWLMRELSLR